MLPSPSSAGPMLALPQFVQDNQFCPHLHDTEDTRGRCTALLQALCAARLAKTASLWPDPHTQGAHVSCTV